MLLSNLIIDKKCSSFMRNSNVIYKLSFRSPVLGFLSEQKWSHWYLNTKDIDRIEMTMRENSNYLSVKELWMKLFTILSGIWAQIYYTTVKLTWYKLLGGKREEVPMKSNQSICEKRRVLQSLLKLYF